MLQYLNSREIKGVSLFGDDANPRKYYYIQQQPRLTSDEKGKPKLGLIQYRDDKQEIAGGYFTLEVNLGVKEETLGEIAKQLETDRHSLEPVPLVDGTVTIRDLNREFDWRLPDEPAATIAGLVMHESRVIPDIGQVFVFHGLRFEVMRRKRHQVAQLRIAREQKAPAPAAGAAG